MASVIYTLPSYLVSLFQILVTIEQLTAEHKLNSVSDLHKKGQSSEIRNFHDHDSSHHS